MGESWVSEWVGREGGPVLILSVGLVCCCEMICRNFIVTCETAQALP